MTLITPARLQYIKKKIVDAGKYLPGVSVSVRDGGARVAGRPPPGPPLTHRKHRFPPAQNYALAAFEA